MNALSAEDASFLIFEGPTTPMNGGGVSEEHDPRRRLARARTATTALKQSRQALGTQALGIALFSYGGQLCWGFNADRDLLPDLSKFVDDVRIAFTELRAAAAPLRAGSPGPRAAALRRGRAA